MDRLSFHCGAGRLKRILFALTVVAAVAHADDRFSVTGQINVIQQRHGSFDSPYSGPNSLRGDPEHATSHVETLFTKFAPTKKHELELDLESAGGRGISDALGLAGFTNLDVVRNPSLGPAPYVARLMYHGTFGDHVQVRAGKMSVVDYFDANGGASDSHLQFMNWTVDNNGAYDYAADTRGYTIGAMAQYDANAWSVRAGIFEMPKVANGIDYDGALSHARGQQVEFERRWSKTTMRLLVYDNLARMGNYRESLALGGTPDITATRRAGRTKYGIGLNGEQSINDALRVFGRAGWSDGRNESFAYTEVDRTLEAGFDVRVPHRAKDKIGVAFVANALASAHREYLARGGAGFLLGDGALRYGREQIFESYYTAHVWRGIYASADVQHIANPGYNRDRGPVWVPGARIHLDF